MAGDVFDLAPLRPPTPPQLALRRAVVRRGKLVVDGNRARRRLISLARWAFPDVGGVRRFLADRGSGPDPMARPARAGLRPTLKRDQCRGRSYPRRPRR